MHSQLFDVLTQGNTYADVGLFQHLDTSEMLIRGMNVLVLNEVTGSIMSSRWFDTYESHDDSGFLLDYIQGLRLGRIICFAIKVSINQVSLRKQLTFHDDTTDIKETSTEIPYLNDVSVTNFWVGNASDRSGYKRNCFNQAKVLPIWVVTRHQYRISVLVSQMSFHLEASSGITKY